MGPSQQENRIVWSGIDHSAPTGECGLYRTEDGTVWRETCSNEQPTGRMLGVKVGNSIKPK